MKFRIKAKFVGYVQNFPRFGLVWPVKKYYLFVQMICSAVCGRVLIFYFVTIGGLKNWIVWRKEKGLEELNILALFGTEILHQFRPDIADLWVLKNWTPGLNHADMGSLGPGGTKLWVTRHVPPKRPYTFLGPLSPCSPKDPHFYQLSLKHPPTNGTNPLSPKDPDTTLSLKDPHFSF